MEIRPASLAQIARGRNGQMVQIDDDVQGCANALNEIDSRLRLRYSEPGEYYVVYWKDPERHKEDGDGELITTATELDHRLVKKVERIYWECQQPGYSFADELERVEDDAKREADHEWSEKHGEMFERLGHAMRKDLGYNQSKIYTGKGLVGAKD